MIKQQSKSYAKRLFEITVMEPLNLRFTDKRHYVTANSKNVFINKLL